MIRKSVSRFSEKIMLKQKPERVSARLEITRAGRCGLSNSRIAHRCSRSAMRGRPCCLAGAGCARSPSRVACGAWPRRTGEGRRSAARRNRRLDRRWHPSQRGPKASGATPCGAPPRRQVYAVCVNVVCFAAFEIPGTRADREREVWLLPARTMPRGDSDPGRLSPAVSPLRPTPQAASTLSGGGRGNPGLPGARLRQPRAQAPHPAPLHDAS